MKNNIEHEIEKTFDLLDANFTGNATGFSNAVLQGIEAEKQRIVNQRKRNATFTAVLVVLFILNVFSIQLAVRRTQNTNTAKAQSNAVTLSTYEDQDVTILINKKITGLSYEK